MIYKSNNKTGRLFSSSQDIRKLEGFFLPDSAAGSYIHTIPVFEKFKGITFSCGKEKINIYKPDCTCEIFRNGSPKYNDQRDLRNLCRHIAGKLMQLRKSEIILIDPLTFLLIETRYKYGPENLIKQTFEDEVFIFGFSAEKLSEWINVYTETENGKGKFFRYGFNPNEARWKRGLKPRTFEKARDFIFSIVKK
jgi:hypothetical protein